MSKVILDYDKCDGADCAECADVCPMEVLVLKGDKIEIRHYFKTEVEDVEYVNITDRWINNYKPQQISKYIHYDKRRTFCSISKLAKRTKRKISSLFTYYARIFSRSSSRTIWEI